MASRRPPIPRGDRRGRTLRPSLLGLEQRVVPSLTIPGIVGIAFDTSGDVFTSYNSTGTSGQQQSVAEFNSSGNLVSASVFRTTGASASPGTLTPVGAASSLPSITSSSAILELQPDGQLFVFDPVAGTSSQYDNLAGYTANASNVFDVQTGASVDLSGQISLAGATYGDFGVYQDSLVVSAESNNWDFVLRLTYGSSGGAATVLAASPVSSGLSAAPGGVAVDSQGTVLATMPYVPAGSSAAIHVAVGFSLSYDTGGSPAPFIPKLGLTSVPNIESAGIAVDSQNNFILAVTDSSLYGGGPGIVHINSALSAFLADPDPVTGTVPSAIAVQDLGGTSELAFTDQASNPRLDTYTTAGELSLFSGQVSPAQLRQAYGIDQIGFAGPGGTTVTGDGTGQTIAIVEEGVDPTLGADLTTFDQYFGIPAPPSFQVVDQNQVTTENLSIVGEASLDVEWAHAVAPGASIIVYNAAYDPNNGTVSFENLLSAMQEASKLPGVSVVSLSYGGAEASLGFNQTSFDSYFTTPGVTFVVAAGDSGIYVSDTSYVSADYPAASPNVVAVGGTSITIDAAGDYPGTGASGEVAWGSGSKSGTNGGGGGGLSTVETEPAWQSGVVPASLDPSGVRALPDVSMDSGSIQPYDVFTSTLSGSSVSASAVGWLGDAGTSASAPIWAGLIVIADQGRVLAGGTPLTGDTQTLPALYSLPSADFHDIVNGNNGDPAGPGYDLASGLGTPVANLLVPDLAAYQLADQISIKTEPPSRVVAGYAFGLTVQVEDRLGNPVGGGTVTVAAGNNPGGATLGGTLTATVADGIATFSDLTLSQPGTGYTLVVTVGGLAGSQTTSSIAVTAGREATKVVATAPPLEPVFGQSVTLLATVSTDGAATGVPTGIVTFQEGSNVLGTATLTDGVAELSITPSAAGNETITIAYGGDAGNQPSSVGLPLSISQATPALTWAQPGDITAGTPLGAAQLDAMATFNGMPLAGVFTYSSPAGTVLPAGSGQTLTVTFTPADGSDFRTVTSSVTINVRPGSTSAQSPSFTTVIGEQPVFRRKLKKNGRPAGAKVLAGFSLRFSAPLSAAASNPANYVLDTVSVKKVKKGLARILHPIQDFTVSYTPGSDSVTLELAGTPSFRSGGRITVLPGVTGDSGESLLGATSFTIAPGGKSLRPA